jgi:hypothetical protein
MNGKSAPVLSTHMLSRTHTHTHTRARMHELTLNPPRLTKRALNAMLSKKAPTVAMAGTIMTPWV